MTIDVEVVRTFLAVIDCGSVIEASRARGFSAAAVSRQIGGLQRRLGIQLFAPDGRSIRPTPAALQLAAPARRLIDEVSRFERFAHGSERGAFLGSTTIDSDRDPSVPLPSGGEQRWMRSTA